MQNSHSENDCHKNRAMKNVKKCIVMYMHTTLYQLSQLEKQIPLATTKKRKKRINP